MRVVFSGTPEFAVPSLLALAHSSHVDLVGVMTQPDRPSGRGRKVQASPVKLHALKSDIPVYQPKTLKTVDAAQQFTGLRPDLLIVVAYGMLLPPVFLGIPQKGCFNVHASLLPRWRGAAPIQRAIEAGDEMTGVSLMRLEQGLDTGAVLTTRSVAIGSRETGGSLHDTLAVLGGKMLTDSLEDLVCGNLEAVVQDDALATYAGKLDKSECPVDWSRPAYELERKIRAFTPWPGATARIGDETVRIGQASLTAGCASAVPGEVIRAGKSGIAVQTLAEALIMETVQRPGGRMMPVAEYLNGRPLDTGTVLPSIARSFPCM